MKNRIISLILSLLMAVNILVLIPPMTVSAAGETLKYEGNGYKVTYSIQNEWSDNKIIQIQLTNTGSSSIVNWGLKYSFAGEIQNIWNAEVYSYSGNEYIISNAGYNYEIKPNQTISFGYLVTGTNEILPQKFELCSKRINKSQGYDVAFEITNQWNDGFNAEITIKNTSEKAITGWNLSFDTNCEIVNIWNAEILSYNDSTYTISCISNTATIPVGGEISFGFQCKYDDTPIFENYKLSEAIILGAEETEEESGEDESEDKTDYEKDTDSDGLPDYYEEIIGSDPNTEHSDDDQIPDGYEALYLGTDPSKSDSDDNGISDADEDFDEDGLSNLEEYNLGTDPFLEDSDYDTLSDKDEVNIHGTNPTKSDTDDDLVPDGDEVKLGLDPNSNSTNGTPDSERTFSQVVTAESEVLAAVNGDEESPFDVSLEITAAGVAENNVYARESGYSNAIENSSIIGIAPEFVYTDGLEVEEVTVKFELEDSIINNTLGTYTAESDEFKGIKRLNIFMFFEDVNMLLPVETFHDEATNTVYTTTDRMGTYCLIDMELFLDNLGIVPEVTEPVEVYSDEEVTVYTDYADVTEVYASGKKYKDNFDVAFLIDSRMKVDTNYANSRKSILEMCDTILSVSPNARIRFIQLLPIENRTGLCYNIITDSSGKEYFTDYDKICDALSEFERVNDSWYSYDSCNVKPGLDHILNTATRETYCFYVLKKNNSMFKGSIDDVSRINSDITVSVVSDYIDSKKSDQKSFRYIPDLCKNTSGQILSVYDEADYEDNVIGKYNFKNRGLGVIYGCVPEIENGYKAIIATGYKTVQLTSSLQQNYEWYRSNELNADDADFDGLYDYQEIMFEKDFGSYGTVRSLINDTDPNNVSLYTYSDILEILGEEYFYVEKGLERYRNATGEIASWNPESLFNIYILPIRSDLTVVDSDEDDISDEEEYFIETSPLLTDTDGDGLDDGTEYINWYDPLDPNPDGDVYNDYEEYINGTNPYGVDFTPEAWAFEFVKGVVEGDIIEDPSIPALLGQIAGGIAPGVGTVADVRDAIVNASRGDWFMFGMSALGIAPVIGDATKSSVNITQFISKNMDNADEIADLLIMLAHKYPEDWNKMVSDSSIDEIIKICEKGNNKLSRENYLKLMETIQKTGKSIQTISDFFPNARKISIQNVWLKGHTTRGKIIDEFLNQHTLKKGLGTNFPVFDRITDGKIISTKSIDLGAPSYQDPKGLNRVLEQYKKSVLGFEEKYLIKPKKEKFVWDNKKLGFKSVVTRSDLKNKAMEIVIPDTIISDDIYKTLIDFVDEMKKNDVEVWFVVCS